MTRWLRWTRCKRRCVPRRSAKPMHRCPPMTPRRRRQPCANSWRPPPHASQSCKRSWRRRRWIATLQGWSATRRRWSWKRRGRRLLCCRRPPLLLTACVRRCAMRGWRLTHCGRSATRFGLPSPPLTQPLRPPRSRRRRLLAVGQQPRHAARHLRQAHPPPSCSRPLTLAPRCCVTTMPSCVPPWPRCVTCTSVLLPTLPPRT